MSKQTSPVQFMCPIDLKDRMRDFADSRCFSMSDVLRLAITDFLDRERTKERERQLHAKPIAS